MSNIKLNSENKEVIDAFNLGVNEGYIAYEEEKLVIKFAEWIIEKGISYFDNKDEGNIYLYGDILLTMEEIYDRFIDSQDL